MKWDNLVESDARLQMMLRRVQSNRMDSEPLIALMNTAKRYSKAVMFHNAKRGLIPTPRVLTDAHNTKGAQSFWRSMYGASKDYDIGGDDYVFYLSSMTDDEYQKQEWKQRKNHESTWVLQELQDQYPNVGLIDLV